MNHHVSGICYRTSRQHVPSVRIEGDTVPGKLVDRTRVVLASHRILSSRGVVLRLSHRISRLSNRVSHNAPTYDITTVTLPNSILLTLGVYRIGVVQRKQLIIWHPLLTASVEFPNLALSRGQSFKLAMSNYSVPTNSCLQDGSSWPFVPRASWSFSSQTGRFMTVVEEK